MIVGVYTTRRRWQAMPRARQTADVWACSEITFRVEKIVRQSSISLERLDGRSISSSSSRSGNLAKNST